MPIPIKKKFLNLKADDLENKIRLPNIAIVPKTGYDENGAEYKVDKNDLLLAIFDTAVNECRKNNMCISRLEGYRILDRNDKYYIVEFYIGK